MWYDLLDNNIKLMQLYESIPELIDVRIESIIVLTERREIKIVFDMPKFFDYLPKHQSKLGANVVAIKLVFKKIDNVNLSFNLSRFRGSILIRKNLENRLDVTLEGDISCNFLADYGEIKEIQTYIK